MFIALQRHSILSHLIRTFSLVLIVGFISSCKSEYEQWVSKELSTGVRNDNLILGIYFGMTKNDFFQHCLELNRQSTITNGPENSTAEITKNGLNDDIAINFYPDFEQDKIHIFRMYFNYKQWSPWNKEFHSDKLLPVAIAYLSKTFNTTFKEMKTPNGKPFWLSIEGNRQIRAFIKDDRTVNTDISDLTVTAHNPKLQPNHPRVTQ
jgi:hypothetical protein